MIRIATATLLAMSVVSVGAQAQRACPDGRTASGQCINPLFADTMRQTAVIFSQPKISYTHYPVMPSVDWKYRYPNQLILDPLRPSPIAPRAVGGGVFIIF
jgi:hypothetical protein